MGIWEIDTERMKSVSFSLACVFLGIFMLHGCAQQKTLLGASQFRFDLEDESYRIRSIFYEDESEAYNELVGRKFLAADFDQDRVIDCILLGEVSLSEAQKVYEYGLSKVLKEDRLLVITPSIDRYIQENSEYHLEIRSFRPANVPPFNQFQMTHKHQFVSPQTDILVDQDADGTLDDVLKGRIPLDQAQERYAEAIRTGLQQGKLVRTDERILVKEK